MEQKSSSVATEDEYAQCFFCWFGFYGVASAQEKKKQTNTGMKETKITASVRKIYKF